MSGLNWKSLAAIYMVIMCMIVPALAQSEVSSNKIVSICAGLYNPIVVLDDGTVWTCGYNYFGKLGDGTFTECAVLGKCNISNVKAMDSGFYHNIAVKKDGTVWTWGANQDGQLGDGTIGPDPGKPTPVKASITNVRSVSAGSLHSVALKDDGTVWTWGNNRCGGLGDGTNISRSEPVRVEGLSGIKEVSAGFDYTLALDNDGHVWAFGANGYGELGDGTTGDRWVPVRISLDGVKAVAAGNGHSLALLDDGTVWAWGCNDEGQLGDGSTVDRLVPVRVEGLADVVAIDADFQFSVALKKDGTLWAWGCSKSKGLFGDGSYYQSRHTTPVRVSCVGDVKMVALGNDFILVLKDDGSLWSWGGNVHGQLGDGTFTTSTPYCKLKPVRVLLGQDMGIATVASPTSGLHGSDTNETSTASSNMGDPIRIAGLATLILIVSGGVIYWLKRR